MIRPTQLLATFAVTLTLLGGCCPPVPSAPAPALPSGEPTATAAVPTATATTPPLAPVDPVTQRADELVARAKAAEPAVTAMLKQLAAEHGAEMVKLKYRLKTHASTERKLRKLHAATPGDDVAAMALDDSLRYTMRVDDEPAGHYLQVVRLALAALERRGHKPARLKNYWPRDDNYSGINAVLVAADGMEWELQFHTSASVSTQDATHAWYEEFRRVDTPLERQRELFDMMTKAWNEVPVPQGVLEPGSIHPSSQLRDRPRP